MESRNIYIGTHKVKQALLVDDDPFMQTVISDLLRELGVAQISCASSGSSGIAAYDRAAQRPDLVLCDLNMPGGDGFQFMEQLAARGFGGGVVLVSGMDARTLHSASLMARFHRLNILATLTKPVDERALAEAFGASSAHA